LDKAKLVKSRNNKFQIVLIAVFTSLTIFVLTGALKELVEVIFIGCIITAIIIGVSYFIHKAYRPSIEAA
jgi:hypothetical protein